jgi:metallo-beta-lactamase family protein
MTENRSGNLSGSILEVIMEIQFFGAAQSVTGSMHVLTVNGHRYLLECGLFQGRRQESFERNRNLPFDAASIDAMVLSHAHIDHSGNIPQLIKQGFQGNIHCTHATHDLVSIMLRDSAHIQEKDAEFVNKRHKKKGLPPVEPLYNQKDVEQCLSHFVGLGYQRSFQIGPDVLVTFHDAGHILGSAIVTLDIQENGAKRRIIFTGDLGRIGLPVIRDPVRLQEADIFITESTYGDRLHDPIENMKAVLNRVVRETVSRCGKIIIPSFSLGRTQEVVYFLHELFNEGLLPEIPIFVDSPLSVNLTEVFRLHPECFDRETWDAFLSNHQDPFGFYRLRYIRSTEESKKLNSIKESCIIISASGMCEAGRILHHLRNNIQDQRNTVLIVGFMAENTLGRRLVEGHPQVRIFGEEVDLNARVEVMHGFSAHADRDALIEYYRGLNKNRLRHAFVVHGEPNQSEALAEAFRQEEDSVTVTVPERLQKVSV